MFWKRSDFNIKQNHLADYNFKTISIY